MKNVNKLYTGFSQEMNLNKNQNKIEMGRNCKMFYNWKGTQLSYIEVNLLRLDYIIDFISIKKQWTQ
jgi:hypothetical protein